MRQQTAAGTERLLNRRERLQENALAVAGLSGLTIIEDCCGS
jgi:hypothetical protein